MTINGSLADINVENRAKRKYPREKSPEPTEVRKSFFNRAYLNETVTRNCRVILPYHSGCVTFPEVKPK